MAEASYQPFEDYQKNVRTQPSIPERKSDPVLKTPGIVTASDIAKLGGFRREFIARRSETPALVHWIRTDFDALVAFAGDVGPGFWRIHSTSSLFEDLVDVQDEDDEVDPHGAAPVQGLSIVQTCITIFKAFIGVGILFVPRAMANAGWVAALTLLTISAVICTIGMLALAECYGNVKASYAGMGKKAFGQRGYGTVAFQIAFSQLMFAATAFIFEADTATSALRSLGFEPPPRWLLFVLAVLVKTPLGWIRKVSSMWFVAIVSNCCVLIAVGFVAFRAVSDLAARDYELHPTVVPVNSQGALAYMGTAIYAFEGIAMVVPIQESMAQPEYFRPVLCGMICFIGMLLGSFSIVTYFAWGDTLADVALNQPLTGGIVFLSIIKGAYVFSSYLSFTFVMFPTFSITERSMFATWNREESSWSRKWAKNLFRTVTTIFTGVLAYGCASFLQVFVSLLGVFCSIPLALWIPGGIHLKLIASSTRWTRCLDWMLVTVGLLITPFIAYTDLQMILVG